MEEELTWRVKSLHREEVATFARTVIADIAFLGSQGVFGSAIAALPVLREVDQVEEELAEVDEGSEGSEGRHFWWLIDFKEFEEVIWEKGCEEVDACSERVLESEWDEWLREKEGERPLFIWFQDAKEFG